VVARAEQEKAALKAYADGITRFTENCLGSYGPRVAAERKFRSKELNDPVWGTVHLTPPEVVLLDSPLVQRLRTIRQLGVVHLVYPGAMHSRLEHSLGVLHQTSMLVGAIRTALVDIRGPAVITAELEQLLRLAAMCHDIGHGLMSHVSENALAGDRSVNQLERAFANEMRVEEPHLSEMAAYFMIRSPAFVDLINFAWTQSALAPPPHDPAEFMSSAIIGLPISEDVPLLHEVITGPFDADKLDYLKRDAVYTGTPNVVDIVRLTRKLRVAPVNWRDLPEEISRRVQERGIAYLITGVAQSGARTLDELALARALLHDKVYRHQKVRASEAMVASVLTVMGGKLGPVELLPLRFTDEQFLDLDAAVLGTLSSGTLEPRKADVAADIIKRLRLRELFVRSFAWEHSPQSVGLATERDQMVALQSLRGALNRRNERGDIAGEIADVIRKILDVVGQPERLAGLVEPRLKNYVWIDPPSSPKGRSLLSRALLITSEGSVRRFRDDFPDTEGWSDQYLVNRDVGYVFAPRCIAVPTYLAAELVVRRKFGVRVAAEDRATTEGIDTAAVSKMRQQLFEAGFYADLPSDLWPMPPELTMAAMGQTIARFLLAGSEFSPPHEDDAPQEPLTPRGVREFARQFANAELYTDVIVALESMRFFKRADLVTALVSFVTDNPAYVGAYVCPIGSAKDSGGIVSYFANDIAETHGLRVVNLTEVPPDAERILLVDDFIGSGRQVVDVLESWLGLGRSYDLGEDRSQTELPVTVAKTLREAELGFSFCAGLVTGPALLADWLQGQGMNGVVAVANPEPTLPSLDKLVTASKISQSFVDACAHVGKSILLSRGYDEPKSEDRKLGYGNRGLLVAFPHNIPAHTATAIWDRGLVDDRQWLPLLPRRRKR